MSLLSTRSRPLLLYHLFTSVTLTALVLILLPLLILLTYLTPENLRVLPPEAYTATLTTLEAATVATLIALLAGTPLAYLEARCRGRVRDLLSTLTELPMVVPHSVAGVAVLLTYGSDLYLGPYLQDLGIVLQDTFLGIVAAMTFVSLPIYVSAVRTALESLDPHLIYVARSLGATWYQVLLRIELPLVTGHIVAATFLTWARAVSEVGAIMVVAYYPKTAQILVIEYLEGLGLRPAATLSALLLAVVLLTLYTCRLLLRYLLLRS